MYTKHMAYLLSGLLLSTQTSPCMAITDEPKASTNTQKSQWKGKRVAFLGDSITDKKHEPPKIIGNIWQKCWGSNLWFMVSMAINGTVY